MIFLTLIIERRIIIMSKKIRMLLIIIGIAISLGVIFGAIDYNRVTNGKMPVFVIPQHDKGGPEIAYYGLGYKIIRNPGVSYKEDISKDNYVKFGLWFYTKKVKSNTKN
jgi:hypothetical protein